MVVNTSKIVGFVVLPNDTVREKSSIIFQMVGFDTDADDSATVVPFPIVAPISSDGSIDVDLWPNPEGVRNTLYGVTASLFNGITPKTVSLGKISVPVSGGPFNLNDLLPVAPPSGANVGDYIAYLASAVAEVDAAALSAAAARDKSRDWAESPTAPGDPGTKSSKTWAGEAGDSAISAASSAVLADARADDAAAFAGFRDFKDLPTLLANTSLDYGGGASQVAAGDIIRTRSEGFSYRVADAGASDHHVTTAGGVNLYVLPGMGEFADIRAFGATGSAADDQDAAAVAAMASDLPIRIPPGFVLRYSTPLVLKQAWEGAAKGDGLPGSVTDANRVAETSELRFTGTGWAVTTRGSFKYIAVRSDGVTVGQFGCRFRGAAIGQSVGPVRVMEFDEWGVEFGNTDQPSGIYFADIRGIEVNNNLRLGKLGLSVVGGGAVSSNANIFTGVFVSGPWETYASIKGHNNTFLNFDCNPKPSMVAALGGTINAGLEIEGDGNTFLNPYIEPTQGEADLYDCLIRFTSTAHSNLIWRMYTPSAGNKLAGLIEDFGAANDVTISDLGDNFTPSVGVAMSEDNLIPNPGFVSPDAATIPNGWFLGGGSTGTFSVDTSVTRRGLRTLKFSTTDTRMQAICYLLSASSLNVRNAIQYYPAATFAKQTLSVGVWCLSNTSGVGSVKVTNGFQTLGSAAHSGSGQWEFLTVRARGVDSPTEVAIALRNNGDFTNSTGDCWFSEPVFVVGNDIPKFAGTRKLDAENPVTMGSFSWNIPRDLPVNDATPDVAEGSLWKEANTAATTITQLDGGREGQEIILTVTSGNTTLQNGANIKTNTGANKLLAANRAYRFVRANSAWWEI